MNSFLAILKLSLKDLKTLDLNTEGYKFANCKDFSKKSE